MLSIYVVVLLCTFHLPLLLDARGYVKYTISLIMHILVYQTVAVSQMCS